MQQCIKGFLEGSNTESVFELVFELERKREHGSELKLKFELELHL